ncbi:hypothetical protein B0J13DRAFT_561396 [Dactylonectria estremocensis]|uniref:Secreted protein n=1 Tax=Dactylonectria estremocensis TaxID=1079267 RepID=A0A9P9E932_9HYPO|nr:hypothetical protein B0J13DRAFT_561396 [Dactylonectria estremocensis]
MLLCCALLMLVVSIASTNYSSTSTAPTALVTLRLRRLSFAAVPERDLYAADPPPRWNLWRETVQGKGPGPRDFTPR